MRKFNELPDEIMRHTRGYGWIHLPDEQKYALIQELFPTFSIERLDRLSRKLIRSVEDLNSDEYLVFNALDDASQYEVYGNGNDITIQSPDVLDLPYPSTELKKGLYSNFDIENVDTILYLLELSATLKFKEPNRNTFVVMDKVGEEFLPFNEDLYRSSYSHISLNSILEYAQKLASVGKSNHKIVRYDMDEHKIYVDSMESNLGTRDDYVKLCMSMSELL